MNNHTAVKQTQTQKRVPTQKIVTYPCYGNNKPCRELCNQEQEYQCLKAAMQYVKALHREEE